MKKRMGGRSWLALRAVDQWRLREAEASSRVLKHLLFKLHPTLSDGAPSTVEERIHFQGHSSDLTGRARAALRAKVAVLRGHPAMRIVIGGFASQPGSRASGMALGLRRVQAIRAYLLWLGIEPVRIGVAIRGAGWSLLEWAGEVAEAGSSPPECRLQVTDPHALSSRN